MHKSQMWGEKMAKEIDEGKIWAILVMVLGALGIAIVFFAKKQENKYVVHYMKQIMTLGIFGAAAFTVVSIIPFLGWFILSPLLGLAMLVFWIIGIVYAIQGEYKELPWIGQYAKEIFRGFK